MPEVTSGLSIGQVAARTGLSVHALRFYEREGILANIEVRRVNGRRVFSEADVEWLTMCGRLRATGMPIARIRRYAELIRDGLGNEADRLDLLRQHRQQIVAQIDELRHCLDLITRKVELYERRMATLEGS